MLEDHVKQANKVSGQEVTYVDRTSEPDKYDDPSYTVNSTTDIHARVEPASEVEGTSAMPWPEIGKLPNDAKLIRVDTDVDADLEDAFDIPKGGDRHEVFKISEMYSEQGKKTGQKLLVKPE